MKSIPLDQWTKDDAEDLYGINNWGADYFAISPEGEVEIVVPTQKGESRVSFKAVIDAMRERDLEMPVLLRIENLLDHRISLLNQAFATAIKDAAYQNVYRGVFPIKVNQQHQVIQEISYFGSQYNHGLEAGSKAELIIALAHIKDNDGYIICNGYKDAEFIDLGLHAIKLGVNCFFVIETPSELPTIIARSQAMGVKPKIGVRLKLASKVDGHWSEDSGDRSIFGLNTIQLIALTEELKQANMLDCFQLVHFHLGSQIPNIRNIRSGMLEACRYYVELVKEGAPLHYMDLGGGLAVDYDGSRSSDTHSMNYQLSEYCSDVVEAIMESLDPLNIPHPVIITESGRATIAYSSVLLFNILDVSHFDPSPLVIEVDCDVHEMVENLQSVADNIQLDRLQETYNDAVHYRDELRELFRRGQVTLRERAVGENSFLVTMQRIVNKLPELDRIPPELESLGEELADIYYGNFSVFQSLPDAWAIDQIFPVMPLHRLNEAPTREAIIADITCDCDGKIDLFASPDGEKRRTLPLHPLKQGEDYYLGVFLVGAYQETLGDLHNLFGDTNVASIRVNTDNSFDVVNELHGDSIADVLSYVEYDPAQLQKNFRNIAERAVKAGKITVADRQRMLKDFSDSLRGYTYYED
ncbi:MAG: arginine decarboxylase [Cellvibrionaceae bacterium]